MLKLDFDYITEQLPERIRRTPIRIDWLKLNSSSIEKDHTTFKDNDYADSYFIAQHNSQIIVLEDLLNSYLVNPMYEITITDGVWYPYVNLYYYEENVFEQTYLYDETDDTKDHPFLYIYETYNSEQIDFKVIVNSNDSDKEDLIKYYIELFQPGGTIYQIEYV